jgi:beta-phosphoglucomutase-like phosphatase (HAD superfamily)
MLSYVWASIVASNLGVPILAAPARSGISKTAEHDTRVSTDAPGTCRVQSHAVTSKETERAELDTLRSKWRDALLAAREALRADEEVLAPAELDAHERQLREDYKTAAVELRQFALDEGLPTELAEPFLPRRLAWRALGLPATVRSCVFELDNVLVGSAGLHRAAWGRTLNELLAAHSYETYGELVAPFDPRTDYPEYIEGRPRLEGLRAFLASRGIRLPEGTADDPPRAETVHGLANHKNEWVGRLLEQHGVAAFDGVRHYLELAHDAGMTCAVVSASAHTEEMLELSGLAELVDRSVDAETIAAGGLPDRPAPDRLLAACRKLQVEPGRAAAFETSCAGVAAARAAGFAWVVAVEPAGGPDELRELRRAGADLAVPRLADLLERSA